MNNLYDKAGKPLDPVQWAKLRGDDSYLRLGFDELENGIAISTVWIGFDSSHGTAITPRGLFETAVLDGHVHKTRELKAYDTEAAALRGHKHMVLKWRSKLRTGREA